MAIALVDKQDNKSSLKEDMMSRKNIYRVAVLIMALVIAAAFMMFDMGLGLTPLTKFFIVFFGGIVGLQCIPAVLLFVGIVRGVFSPREITETTVGPLTRSGVKL